MEKIFLSDKLSVSRIIYGMWRLMDDKDTSVSHIQAKIEACLEQGITTIDQADIYGGYRAESLLGATLRQVPSLRDQLQIITKCGIIAPTGIYSDKPVKYYDTSPEHITQSVERSLIELSTDHIDLLLLHRPDPLMCADETGAALDALIESGKVKSLGVSNFRPRDFELLQSRMTNPLSTNQIEINLINNTPLTNGDLTFMQQHKIAPMAWSPLAGGQILQPANTKLNAKINALADSFAVNPASIAIAWLLRHPAKILPVMGSNRIERIKLFSEATRVALDHESWFELLEAAKGRAVP